MPSKRELEMELAQERSQSRYWKDMAKFWRVQSADSDRLLAECQKNEFKIIVEPAIDSDDMLSGYDWRVMVFDQVLVSGEALTKEAASLEARYAIAREETKRQFTQEVKA